MTTRPQSTPRTQRPRRTVVKSFTPAEDAPAPLDVTPRRRRTPASTLLWTTLLIVVTWGAALGLLWWLMSVAMNVVYGALGGAALLFVLTAVQERRRWDWPYLALRWAAAPPLAIGVAVALVMAMFPPTTPPAEQPTAQPTAVVPQTPAQRPAAAPQSAPAAPAQPVPTAGPATGKETQPAPTMGTGGKETIDAKPAPAAVQSEPGAVPLVEQPKIGKAIDPALMLEGAPVVEQGQAGKAQPTAQSAPAPLGKATDGGRAGKETP